MEALAVPGNPPLEVVVRRSARARRLTLRVSRIDGRVTLTLPARTSVREGRAFVTDRADWIRAQIEDAPSVNKAEVGGMLPFRGAELEILGGPVRAPREEPGRIIVPANRPTARTLHAWLKLRAREALIEASTRYAGHVDRRFDRITLRDTRSRWGSCSSERNLMYSWRLIMAPPEVLDYVAAHEVAHLVHMDHSAAFWSVVERISPDHKLHRRWLREHGPSLHRIRFEDA